MERHPPPEREETVTRLPVVTLCGTAVCGCFILLVSGIGKHPVCLGVVRSGRNPSLGMLGRKVVGIQLWERQVRCLWWKGLGVGSLVLLAFIHFLDPAGTHI